MSIRPVVVDIPATPQFDFLYGRYKLSSWAIPYFSTIMSMRAAADSLGLSADSPGSDAVKWQLDELYQREIDWPRVERRIVPYLSEMDKPAVLQLPHHCSVAGGPGSCPFTSALQLRFSVEPADAS